MADPKTDKDEGEEGKKPSSVGFIIAFVIVTVIAAAAGWVLGGQFFADSGKKEMQASNQVEPEKSANAKGDEAEKEEMPERKSAGNPVVRLEPIIVALRNSGNVFLRLELAVITGSEDDLYDEESKLRLVDAISTYSKTVSIKHISGPSGYLHFREDVLDVARLSTEGAVKDILILSMVAE